MVLGLLNNANRNNCITGRHYRHFQKASNSLPNSSLLSSSHAESKMQANSGFCFLSFSKLRILNKLNPNVRHFAKPAGAGIPSLGGKKGKALAKGPTLEKKILPVVTDPKRLVNYVCGSCIYKEGEDIKLGDDSQYPDWLWTLRTGPAPPLEELSPETDEYWGRLRQQMMKRNNRLAKLRKF
ncbi:unnamed protein product [Allacma fusca]|uniref:Large ribosomal subunit protein mL54 n=1 Tax=Allacma fusca TaxID=39272 RepID=A0A8J2JT89_9HEXA|nr:unnamed protein product [Allacma fusca]